MSLGLKEILVRLVAEATEGILLASRVYTLDGARPPGTPSTCTGTPPSRKNSPVEFFSTTLRLNRPTSGSLKPKSYLPGCEALDRVEATWSERLESAGDPTTLH